MAAHRNTVASASVAIILLLVASVGAEPVSIGVNFFQKTTVDSTSSPGLVHGENWNNVSTAVGTTRNLHDDSRDTTPADVTVVSGRSWNGFGAGTTGNPGFNRIVSDGVFGSGAGDNDDQVGISFAQIPYAIYDVYVFTQSRTTNDSALSVTLGDTTYYYTTDGHSVANEMKQIASKTPGAPTKGGSYALFRNVSGDSFAIKTGGSRTGVISNQIFGVHIVASSNIPLAIGRPPITTTAFFSQHCVKCHGPQKHKGDVRLDQIGSGVSGDNHKLWENVVHNIQRGDMPPKDETQPSRRHRQAFLKQAMSMLERHNADNQIENDPLLRLTNQQIAHSLQDLLGTATHIADRLIRDPVDKHGFSRQNDLDLSGSHLLLYADLLNEMLQEVFPDNLTPSDNVFRVTGNDWEKCHWAGDNFLYRGLRRLYEGPDWLADSFRIPIPPKHEFRIYLRDNRNSGRFRVGLTVRNEPPANGGPRVPQELGIYLCQGGDLPYKLVRAIRVPAKEGAQHFELFGSLADHLGTSTKRIVKDDRSPGYWLSFRTLTITNHNELKGYRLPGRHLSTDPIFLVRADDQWIKAFGNKPGLRASVNGNNGRHGNEGGGAAVYPDAMKSHGHAIIERVEFEVPYHASWPPPVVKPFLKDGRISRESLKVGLKQFAARAWRRPLDAKDTIYIELLCEKEQVAGRSGTAALRNVVKTILLDSKFLYLNNSDRHGLASRLSYFLWNGPPDDRLTAAIGSKTPISDDVVKREVDRLLADKRSERFVSDFVGQWIDFTAFDAVAIDPNYYPRFKNTRLGVRTKEHMKLESVAFFSEILHRNLSCMNFLESDFVMLNDMMAEHYGAPPVHSARFVRAPALKTRGGGILAHASFLLGHSNGQDAHAIKRGVWLRGRLLGDPPADPPPEVPGLEEQPSADKPQGRQLSIKEKFDRHLATGTTCYDCHKDIDHWGIAMEGFDAVGLPRTKIVKAGPVLKDVAIAGHAINGLLPLKQYLVEKHLDEFSRGFTQHMLSYALGRPLTYRDEQQIANLQGAFKKSGYQMRSLIHAIATSPDFGAGRIKESHRDNNK